MNPFQESYSESQGMETGKGLLGQLFGGSKWGDLADIFDKKLGAGGGGNMSLASLFPKSTAFFGSNTGKALMKGLGASGGNPLLFAGKKLFSSVVSAKANQKQFDRITDKIDEIGDSVDESLGVKTQEDLMAKDDFSTGIQTSGRAASRGKEQIDASSEATSSKAGFAESGDVNYTSQVATKQIDEDFGSKRESLEKVLGQTLAENQTQFDDFKNKADETMQGLRAARGKLKTKWYQNLIS